MYKNKLQIISLKKDGITDFSEERNKLLKATKADWVFFLDSDEQMSQELLNEVKKVIKESKFNGFFVYRWNYFLGKFIGTDKILRLARMNSGFWERRVHEVWKIKGMIGQIKTPLIHNTAANLAEYINKINFYSKLHAKENSQEGKNSNLTKVLFYPLFKFIQSIFMGRGVVFSILQAFHSFLAWSQLLLWQKK